MNFTRCDQRVAGACLAAPLAQRFAYRSAGVDNALVELGNLHLATKLSDVQTEHPREASGDDGWGYFHLLITTRRYRRSFHDTNKKPRREAPGHICERCFCRIARHRIARRRKYNDETDIRQ